MDNHLDEKYVVKHNKGTLFLPARCKGFCLAGRIAEVEFKSRIAMMISILYTIALLTILAYYAFAPRKRFNRPPSTDNDDDGGEPLGDDLPDLDLPPGISLPINDYEPKYDIRRIKVPKFPEPSFH